MCLGRVASRTVFPLARGGPARGHLRSGRAEGGHKGLNSAEIEVGLDARANFGHGPDGVGGGAMAAALVDVFTEQDTLPQFGVKSEAFREGAGCFDRDDGTDSVESRIVATIAFFGRWGWGHSVMDSSKAW